MKYLFLLITYCFVVSIVNGHGSLEGRITDADSKIPLQNAFVKISLADNKITYSDIDGRFEFKFVEVGKYIIEYALLGYKSKTDTIEIKDKLHISISVDLQNDIVEMPSVNITARRELAQTTINSLDFKLRTHNTTQDLLRLVPGLFIAQHAGGGKAEQIFLRGFDVDHGTDVAVSVDGMPVNMVSHAHGQGYADLHFVIPEIIDNINFSKGPYDAAIGNLNTAGAVRFQTKNYLQKNTLKYEIGMFGTQRGMAMFNIIPYKIGSIRKHSAYIASEYNHSNGYFESPQNLRRFNIFGKYNGNISDHSNVSVSISTFKSSWKASGQIPDRAVESGLISRYGSIDPSEGGRTSRTNINVTLTNYLSNSGVIKNQLFYTKYQFDLYSNFTLFKDDTLNGDEIRQFENRDMLGYKGSYSNDLEIGPVTIKGTVGLGIRADRINDISLQHVVKQVFLEDKTKGNIREYNYNVFGDLTFLISEKITLNTGLRYDLFSFFYKDKLRDSTLPSMVKGILSPKVNLYYKAAKELQFYLSAGYGFHSNDARVSVAKNNTTSLPRAKSIDLGTNFKLKKKLFVNTAIWYMTLESEYVYGGDDGLLSPSGASVRTGIDVSARYQLLQWLFLDGDINLARPRYQDLPENENFVPLAPHITSVGGIGINLKGGLSGSFRYRYLGDRPAVEDKSVIASGYNIMDAVINYQKKYYALQVSAENIFNSNWKEAQFGTESRLKGEPGPVTEIHFTPGSPFFIKGSVSFLF